MAIGDFWIKSPTNNSAHVLFFYRATLQMQNGIAAVFKRTDKLKVPLPSKLNSLSESFNTWCSRMHLSTTYASIPMSQRQHKHAKISSKLQFYLHISSVGKVTL